MSTLSPDQITTICEKAKLARDDFSRAVIDRMAKRVGMKCSCPDCRAPTSGPDGDGGATNTGVAAHISAASPGGARYDDALTSELRSDITNGIWLCQNHAKIIDDDETTYTAALLREWKETAEHMAALEARGYAVRKARRFADLERKLPNLLAEIRQDLSEDPLVRQIILLSKRFMYTPGITPYFVYYYEAHEKSDSMLKIMQHYGAVYDISFNDMPRYNLTEEFVSFLVGDA